MTHVSLQSLSKTYAGNAGASLDALSLEVASGEITALLGPSGCGKTTALKLIAGLLAPDSGDVLFDSRSVINVEPERRGAVMVFQNHLLFPYMSVEDNIGFGLKMRKVAKSERESRVRDMLGLVKLSGLEKRKPMELSGGQQQRAALARALIVEPRVLLLDEPLSSLDAHLRIEMRELISSLQRSLKMTTVFVTHDQEEAVVMADKIALLLDGRMTQYDTPDAFYSRPADEHTARFFGGLNFFPGRVSEGRFQSSHFTFNLPDGIAGRAGTLTFRPENVRIGDGLSGQNTLQLTVLQKLYLGTQTRLVLKLGDTQIVAIVNPAEAESLTPGDTVPISVAPEHLWLLPA